MDLSEITQFRLFKADLVPHTYNDKYWFKTIDTQSFAENIEDIEKVIQYHYEDLNWDDTPTTEVVLDRLKFGSQCHLWMYEERCLGWHWTNPNCITLDWKSEYQPLKSNEIYIGGALVSRQHKPDKGNSARIFYRQGFEYSFKFTNTDIMYLYSDSWNRASAQLCLRNGFKYFNFL